MTPRIALAQMEVKPGLPEHNVASMLRFIDEARRAGAELVVFPEMCVGGYLVGDRFLEDAYVLDLMRWDERILEASRDIAIAWGNIHLDTTMEARGFVGYHPNKDGRRRRYNAIHVAQGGKYAPRRAETSVLPPGIQPKTLLPNYRFFDDVRYFFSLQDVALDASVPVADLAQPFLLRLGGLERALGFELCEDLWCEDYRASGRPLNTTAHLIEHGAELIVNLSASPWTFGKNGARDRRVAFLKRESGDAFVPFLYVNVVGAQNNGKNVITFDGGSTVYDASGVPIRHARAAYEEELILVDDLHGPPAPRVEAPRIAQKYRALITGIRHVKDFRGASDHPTFIIGLSGGIDSSVSAALLVQAVGRERVLGVNMPTRFNTAKTIQAAHDLADRLGIRCTDIPITPLVEVNTELLVAADLDGQGKALSVLNEENIQAKIRGTAILSNLAAKYGGVFPNNGNKLEIALGYATLYGDWGGAISILGDLTKAEVYQMARYLNAEVFGREVVPSVLIPDALFRFRPDQIAPTAELKENQLDPMKFGYHCALLEVMTDYKKRGREDILRAFLEGTLHELLGIDVALMERWEVHRAEEFLMDLEWFTRSIEGAVFKRVQAPPIIVTSKSGYGYDIRESILPSSSSRAVQALEARIRLERPEYVPASR